MKKTTAIILALIMIFMSVSVMAEETLLISPNPNDKVTVETVAPQTEITYLYVATNGSDDNAGTIDAPFATIEKARDTIRELKKSGNLADGGAVVYIRGGEYYISKKIYFKGEEDSGTKDAPILYRNYPGEEVNLIGAAKLDWSNFVKTTDEKILNRVVDENAREHIYQVNLKELGFTKFPELPLPGSFSYDHNMSSIIGNGRPQNAGPELIVNGKIMTIARYPNEGFMNIGTVIDPGAHTQMWSESKKEDPNYVPPEKQIPYPFVIGFDDERLTHWGEVNDGMISGYFYYSWGDQTVPIDYVDPVEKTITSVYPSCYSVKKGQQVFVYNLLEEIDIPGEFFLDRKTGILYFYPVEEEFDTVYYTTLDTYMFELESVEYVNLKGLNMGYTQGGVVYYDCSKNCSLSDSFITLTGYQSVNVLESSNIHIYDSYFYNVEGGIDFKNCGDRQTLTSSGCLVENCEFEACDRITKTYKQGVKISGGAGVKMINNTLHDSDHNIIQFAGNDHEILYNEVYDACLYADDMGAIYAGRNLTCRGNIIAHNYFHDIGSKENRGNQGLHAVYLDDCFSAADIYGNVFDSIAGSPIMLAGSYNKIYNNVFANNTDEAGRLTQSYDYGSPIGKTEYTNGINAVPYMSEIWTTKYPTIVNVIDEEGNLDMNNHIEITNNILYNTPDFVMNDKVKETVVFENNPIFEKDPGFTDLENKDFTLKEDSVAFKEIDGFKQIEFYKMGQYSDRAIEKIEDSYVYNNFSPYMFKNGEKVNAEEKGIKVIDGIIYLPIRSGAEIATGDVNYDEETELVTVKTDKETVEFVSGDREAVSVNGEEYALSYPVKHMSDTNFMSVEDIANIFGKKVIQENNLLIIGENDSLFDETEAGLIRYIESEISVY